MLFNSHEFIFLFLPICLLAYFTIARFGAKNAVAFLVVASLAFYSWWKFEYLFILVGSILFNYWCGELVAAKPSKKGNAQQKVILTIGIICNLALLGYYKYTNFMVEQLNLLAGWDKFHLETILLPLAISFFTFQQIAYLVDSFKGEIREHSFLQYCLFVTFFPQLIAGPIVHHKEMLPQFDLPETFKPNSFNIAIGLSLFTIGLFKKVVLADNVAVYATPVFQALDAGKAVDTIDAWIGTTAYTLQLYFDFSGYSDMALGLARMFGIKLPENFNSPYKARNIIDFWRRWHITLSRFLRDYLYIALGGNRKGPARRYINLFITMLLGGIWHGAGWNFVIWGALHGSYLMINHGWRAIRSHYFSSEVGVIESALAWFITFLAVMLAWVFFRAETLPGALSMLSMMAGIETKGELVDVVYVTKALKWCIPLLLISFIAPNSKKITDYLEQLLASQNSLLFRGKTVVLAAVTLSFVFLFSVTTISSMSEFLYFNF
ncbi:MAG: alginate O-acetyltransferase complex protein AlgI [Colwellia sp.]|jgi:alginate O-acetyltransferase complex protein AlgI